MGGTLVWNSLSGNVRSCLRPRTNTSTVSVSHAQQEENQSEDTRGGW